MKQLAAMGTREVVLIGGEAYLHDGFLDVIRALRAEGIQASMTTGGLGVTSELALAMAEAGLQLASVSVDGLEATHDRQRARTGSFRGALAALGHLREAGVTIASNVNVNRLNLGELEALYSVLRDAGIRAWQVQITTPLGRAADRPVGSIGFASTRCGAEETRKMRWNSCVAGEQSRLLWSRGGRASER